MPLPKKEGIKISMYLRKDLYDKITDYAEKKGQTKTRAVEDILDLFFNEKKNE